MNNHFRRLILGLACFSFILGNIAITRAGDWPYWGHDLKNSGSTSDIGPAINNLLWKYELGQCAYITSPMIIHRSTGYFTDDSGKIFAINLEDPQRMRWVYQLERAEYYFANLAPAADGNNVYIAGDRKIYALNSENGMLQKTYETESAILGFTIYNGRIYITEKNKLTALESETGGIKWQFSFLEKPAPANNNDPSVMNDPRYPAIDAERNIIYITNASSLYAIDLINGITKWFHKFPNAEEPPIIENDSRPYPFYSASSPVIGSDGIIYINYGRDLWAIHPDSTVKWSFRTEYPIFCTAAVNKVVYAGDQGGKLYALSKDDASLLWDYKTQGQIFTPPIIGGNGTCYLASGDGIIYALGEKENLIWIYGTEHCYYGSFSGLTLSDGKLYVTSRNELLTFGGSGQEPSETLNIFMFLN